MIPGKMRIAFVGTFDLPNYGDHIFPIVFRKKLIAMGADLDIDLYSIKATKQALNQENEVYSVRDLEQNHLRQPYTAIVIAGGGIIHFKETKQKVDDTEYIQYSYAELWGLPTYVANKYHIKLIWNAPEIPYEIDLKLLPIFSSLADIAGYLAVRDEMSRNFLGDEKVIQKAHLVPDTGLLLSEVLPKEATQLPANLSFLTPDAYVVFHIATSDLIKMSSDEQQNLVKMLLKLKSKGLQVVLLPLAYTFEDENALAYINTLSNNSFYLQETPYSFSDILSLIANASLYIGVSLHGSMTAMEYGKKAVAFDKVGRKKVRSLYESVLDTKWYTTDVMDLDSIVSEVFDNQMPANFIDVRKQLDLHFAKVLDYLKSDFEAPESVASLFVETTQMISKFDDNLNVTHQYSLQVKELERIVTYKEQIIISYESEKQALLSEKDELLNNIKKCQKDFQDLQVSYKKTLRYKALKIFSRIKHIFKY